MTPRPFHTALVGFGRVAAGYADDPVMAQRIPYATHVQAVTAHPSFALRAVVDPREEARREAVERWRAGEAAPSLAELQCRAEIEVAVLAGPPETRLDAIAAFPNLRAALVEKPVAPTLAEARHVVESCRARGVTLAVNLMRRADTALRELAGGGLRERIGAPQAAFAVYGGGLDNNGVHLLDLVDMLLGAVKRAQATSTDRGEGFVLHCASGAAVTGLPIDFRYYRENGLDIWGERGRLSILHEGLTLVAAPVGPHRYATGERELAHDAVTVSETDLGRSFWEIYDNLSAALARGEAVHCSGETALRSSAVIDAIRRSAAAGGAPMEPAA